MKAALYESMSLPSLDRLNKCCFWLADFIKIWKGTTGSEDLATEIVRLAISFGLFCWQKKSGFNRGGLAKLPDMD